ncbi:MAG: hypothetical protein ABSA31_03840 [Acidimicrobiales bacterium]|jgi:hypothetical protein
MHARNRRVERFEFVPEDAAMVVTCMTQFAAAGRGWINLLPGFADDEDAPTMPTGLWAIFGGGNPVVTMCSWVPAARDRRRPEHTRLGITHSCGRRAAERLRAQDVGIPAGWFVEQDHVRRGLVLRVPPAEAPEKVLDWALRAGKALSNLRTTERWQAEVHFPTD